MATETQFGGGRMGGVPLNAGGEVQQPFTNIPQGPISRILLKVAFSLLSTAAAFAMVVNTTASAAAEGVDDLDLLLNAMFTSLRLFWDPNSIAGTLTPAQWRTVLGLFNQRDFTGTVVNGVSVPISSGSAKALYVTLTFPVTLDMYFDDGAIFANGSARLKTGAMAYTSGASLTPTVVLANGSAVVSGLSIDLKTESGAGTSGDIGHLWRVQRRLNLSNVYTFEERVMRLALLDILPAATNPGGPTNVGPYELWTPDVFATRYQGERLNAGGYDVTARCTPYLWVEKSRKFLDFAATSGDELRIDITSGVSSVGVYDIQAIPPDSSQVQAVATHVGGGGETHVTHPAPASLPPGYPIPAALAHLLPIRVQAGSAPTTAGGAATNHATAQGVANAAAKRQAVGQAAKAKGGFLARIMGRN